MPIYDFECSSCGHLEELMRKVSAPSTETCPKCQQLTLSKKLSAPNFQLTGSGWYATDFKQSPNAKPEATSSKDAPAPAAACAPGCGCH